MANFDFNGFSETARQQGFNDDEIQGFLQMKGLVEPEVSPQPQPQGGFFRRAALSFGGEDAAEEIRRIEETQGTRGRFDIGDIADIVGEALPIAGGILGAGGGTILGTPVGGAIGGGIGVGAGEAARRAIGQALGVRGEKTVKQEVLGPVTAGVTSVVAGKIIGGVSKYAMNRFPKLLGIIAGEDSDVIEAALRNPQLANKAIKAGDEQLRNAIRIGAEQSVKLKSGFIQGHKLAFDKLAAQNKDKLVGRSELLNPFFQILKDNKVKIGKGNQLDFAISKIKANPGEITKIKEVAEAINKWDDFTLSGINDLKQLVGRLTRFADEAGIPSKSPILGSYYHSIDNLIKQKLPSQAAKSYGILNKRFSENIEVFDDLVDAFHKGDPFVRIANVFGKNKDTIRQLIDFYEKKSGQAITPIVAGRKIAEERAAAFGFLNPREWIDLLLSPKVQARAITKIGEISQTKPIRALGGFLKGL